jgi:hypothetical protein
MEYTGRLFKRRQLLQHLKPHIEPLLDAGICRKEIWMLIRSSGLQISVGTLSKVFSELFGPGWRSADNRSASPRFNSVTAEKNISECESEARPVVNRNPDFRLSFGDEAEALRQQERLARARASIAADRERIRREKEERERQEREWKPQEKERG